MPDFYAYLCTERYQAKAKRKTETCHLDRSMLEPLLQKTPHGTAEPTQKDKRQPPMFQLEAKSIGLF
jgi:hypothetical protein